MLKLSANVSLMFAELPFLERFAAAARTGFEAVEIMYPYAFDAADIEQQLHASRLAQSVINLPPGDYERGDRGLAGLAGREDEYRRSLELGLTYAKALRCERLHLLTGNLDDGATLADMRPYLITKIKEALHFFEPHGVIVLLEPLSKYIMPRYSVSTVREAVEIIDDIGSPYLRLQLDLYHTQMEEGNLSALIERYFDYIDYVQIAGVPGRHEPDVGEINYRYILDLLEQKAFRGWVGCEYVPLTTTEHGLAWARRYGITSQ